MERERGKKGRERLELDGIDLRTLFSFCSHVDFPLFRPSLDLQPRKGDYIHNGDAIGGEIVLKNKAKAP